MNGIILHTKYCFMPNKLGGCGVQGKSVDLLEYGATGKVDRGLSEILKTFEAAYPYLLFIARANNIMDPFDKRVVEAYWIGNELLERIDKKLFYDWCYNRYGKTTDKRLIKILVGKVPMGALPHHSFHVFNSYLRNQHFSDLLYFINQCRISNGKVINIDGPKVEVEYRPIILGLTGLSLGDLEEKTVLTKINDKSFVSSIKVGDQITFHWGWACEIISNSRAVKLEKYTSSQLKLFNQMDI